MFNRFKPIFLYMLFRMLNGSDDGHHARTRQAKPKCRLLTASGDGFKRCARVLPRSSESRGRAYCYVDRKLTEPSAFQAASRRVECSRNLSRYPMRPTLAAASDSRWISSIDEVPSAEAS